MQKTYLAITMSFLSTYNNTIFKLCFGFQTDVSNDDVFVKENSSILLVCPFLEEKTSIVWRGPPNLTIYVINETINEKLINIKHQTFLYKDEKSQSVLKIGMFSENNVGVYRCETVKDNKPIIFFYK